LRAHIREDRIVERLVTSGDRCHNCVLISIGTFLLNSFFAKKKYIINFFLVKLMDGSTRYDSVRLETHEMASTCAP